jgi:hypothetical protein
VIATVVDTDALLQVLWVSVVAGVGVTSCYGLAILGAARAVEYGRDGRLAEATFFAVVGFLGFAVVIGAIVFGILMLLGD